MFLLKERSKLVLSAVMHSDLTRFRKKVHFTHVMIFFVQNLTLSNYSDSNFYFLHITLSSSEVHTFFFTSAILDKAKALTPYA